MTTQCPQCRFENPGTQKFCGECGAPLRPHQTIADSRTETLQPSIRELAPGTTFAGRCQVIEELDKGGIGRVYKVHDT